MDPNLDLITLTPICPHTKSMPTMVLSVESKIEIIPENGEEEIYLTVDGQKATKVEQRTKIKVERAEKSVQVLLFKVRKFEIKKTFKDFGNNSPKRY